MDIEKTVDLLIEDGRRMWEVRWLGFIGACLAATVGWIAVRTLPDNYTATARVYVNAGTVLKPLLQGLTVPTDSLEQVNLMTRALLSRPHLESVADKTGLSARTRTTADRDRLLERLHNAIAVTKVPNVEVYEISYHDHNPVMARAVVQTLLEDFMAKSLTEDVAQSVQAQQFLETQIQLYEKRLTESEARLADFKKKNLGAMPGTAGDFYNRLQADQAAAQSLESQISTLTNRRDEMVRQLAGTSRGTGGGGNADLAASSPTSVDATIASMEADLGRLRIRFTENHPDVVRTKQTLEELYRARNEERKSRAVGGPQASARAVDPVYQQMRLAISNADADLAGLRAQLREKNSEVASLRSMVNTIPEVEAQLKRLDRDYNVVKAQYDILLQRLESAKMNQEVQQDSKNVLFRILDPPRTPVAPTSPNRLAFNTIVLVAALGFGLLIAFLLSQRDPTYFTSNTLREATSLPVYGTIGVARETTAREKEWWLLIALGALLLAYGIVLAFGGPHLADAPSGVIKP